MDTIENIVEAAQLGLSHWYHTREINQSKKLHLKSIDLAKEQFVKDIQLSKQTYLMDVFLNLEQHFQQLNADLISSSKESERDMFDQRNQQFQTIILASSVMFSALSTVIIQGPLDPSSSTFLLVTYALSTSLSFAFLFLALILCIEIINRASTFMYKRARKQTEQLKEALDDSKKAMKQLRNITLLSNSSLNQPTASNNNQNSHRPTFTSGEMDVDKGWSDHESQVHEFLRQREEINDKAAMCAFVVNYTPLGRNDEIDPANVTFENFWDCRCKKWGELAIYFFYLGSVAFLIGIMIFMWSIFDLTYNSTPGASLAVALIAVGLIGGLGTVIGLRNCFRPNYKHTDEEQLFTSLQSDGGKGDSRRQRLSMTSRVTALGKSANANRNHTDVNGMSAYSLRNPGSIIV